MGKGRTACWIALLVLVMAAAPARAEPQPSSRLEQLIARGQARWDVGDRVSAVAFYRDAIAAAPRDQRGYAALGQAYLDLAEPARAVEVYEAGTRAVADGDSLWLGLARAYLAAGHPERALSTLRRLVLESPEALDARVALGEAALAAFTWTEALAAERAALTLLGALPGESARAAQTRLRVRALEITLGPADRAHARDKPCNELESPVRRALAGCR